MIDEMTATQVRERAGMTPDAIIESDRGGRPARPCVPAAVHLR